VGIYFINDLLKDDGIFFTFQEFHYILAVSFIGGETGVHGESQTCHK